jgi:hypothetical protein
VTDLEADFRALRRELQELAGTADDDLDRYWIASPSAPPGIYWKARWFVGWMSRRLEALGVWRPDPWPVRLRQDDGPVRATPLLVWAVGLDPSSLRKSCEKLCQVNDLVADYAPVLVTDVADFSYYSRLGWLIEYLPGLAGEGEAYQSRKARFLARLYRGAPALPADAILRAEWAKIRACISS